MFRIQQDNATRFFDDHGSDIHLKVASHIPASGYPVPPTWNNTTVSNYQPTSALTGIHHAMQRTYLNPTPQAFYAPAHLSASFDVASMPPAAPSPGEITSSEDPPELQVSDEVFAQIAADIIAFGLKLRRQWEREVNLVPRKRCGLPGLDPGAGPSGWRVEGGGPGDAGKEVPRRIKKRRTNDDDETGIKWATQRAVNQELPAQRTPINTKDKSKHGYHAPRIEALVVPLQGVSPPHQLGPSIAQAAPRSHEYVSQAWMREREAGSDIEETMRVEDVHDEKESDKDRWARLMKYDEVDRKWRCVGCRGRPFADRPTLQRHCKSSSHEKERDRRQCPLCPKNYLRQSNLNRHTKAKHPGWRGKVGI